LNILTIKNEATKLIQNVGIKLYGNGVTISQKNDLTAAESQKLQD